MLCASAPLPVGDGHVTGGGGVGRGAGGGRATGASHVTVTFTARRWVSWMAWETPLREERKETGVLAMALRYPPSRRWRLALFREWLFQG